MNPSLPGNSYTSLGGLEAVLRDLYLTFSSLVLSSLGKIVSSCGLLCSSGPMGALDLRTEYQGGFFEFSRILECFDAELSCLEIQKWFKMSSAREVCHGPMVMGYEYVLETSSC